MERDLLSSLGQAAAAWGGTSQDLADVLVLAEIAWDLWWGGGTFPELPADMTTETSARSRPPISCGAFTP